MLSVMRAVLNNVVVVLGNKHGTEEVYTMPKQTILLSEALQDSMASLSLRLDSIETRLFKLLTRNVCTRNCTERAFNASCLHCDDRPCRCATETHLSMLPHEDHTITDDNGRYATAFPTLAAM